MTIKTLHPVHCVKSVRIRSSSGPYFSAFGLNKDRYSYLSIFNPNAGKYGPEKLRIKHFLLNVTFEHKNPWGKDLQYFHRKLLCKIADLNILRNLIYVTGRSLANLENNDHNENIKIHRKCCCQKMTVLEQHD